MDEMDLQVLFCLKINREYRQYKDAMLDREPEEIWNSAYEIDNHINLYELLLEMSQNLGEDALIRLIAFPGLLAFLYARWLKWTDSYTQELEECLKSAISEIFEMDDTKENRKGNDAA